MRARVSRAGFVELVQVKPVCQSAGEQRQDVRGNTGEEEDAGPEEEAHRVR